MSPGTGTQGRARPGLRQDRAFHTFCPHRPARPPCLTPRTTQGMWQEVKECTQRAPPTPFPHSGGCLGVSSSPFTRAMFRPLPTLSFTGLMILKKKRKKKCDSGSPVWNELLQDSGLGQGPRAARQSNRKCPAGLRPCFLRGPGGGLGSRGVTRGLSGPEQSAQRKGPGSPLLSAVSLGALASISGCWFSGPPSLPGLNSRAPCASGHRAGQAQPAPWGPLRGNSDGKLSPPWGAGWGPCAGQLWPPCCPHAEACLR